MNMDKASPNLQHDGIALDDVRLQALEKSVRKIFSENDFHAADMRTIARETGMGFNTIYKYFGDKEGLLFYFVRQWQNDLNEQVLEQINAATGGKDKLNLVLATFLDYYQNNQDIGKIFFLTLPMTTWMTSETFSQRALIDTVLAVIKQAQANSDIRDDIPAVAILDMLLGMIHRAFTMWIYRGAKPPLKSQAEVLFSLFWNAITNMNKR